MKIRTALMLSGALAALPLVALAKDPSLGKSTFFVYEGFMSPQQQSGDEADAPKVLTKATGLQATQVAQGREQRKSLGWGQLRFARDLSRAWVDVEVSNINPTDILMFHIHCGPPGLLGPIVVDFGKFGDLTKTLANGKLSVELKNADLSFITQPPHGMKPALPETCPIDLGFNQTQTIAGLDYLARKGVLYFNLHTKANTFYGEVRGQIYPATKD